MVDSWSLSVYWHQIDCSSFTLAKPEKRLYANPKNSELITFAMYAIHSFTLGVQNESMDIFEQITNTSYGHKLLSCCCCGYCESYNNRCWAVYMYKAIQLSFYALLSIALYRGVWGSARTRTMTLLQMRYKHKKLWFV